MTVTFRANETLHEFVLFDGERFLCKVFQESDALRICAALNAGPIGAMSDFIRDLTTVGQGDLRNAEVLLALVREGARFLAGTKEPRDKVYHATL